MLLLKELLKKELAKRSTIDLYKRYQHVQDQLRKSIQGDGQKDVALRAFLAENFHLYLESIFRYSIFSHYYK
jgi:hypothetical protein